MVEVEGTTEKNLIYEVRKGIIEQHRIVLGLRDDVRGKRYY